MIANVPNEVIPVWFIEKWMRENCQDGSILGYWMNRLLQDWKEYEENPK